MKINFAIICALFCALFAAGEPVLARSAPLVDKSYPFESKSPQTVEQIRGYILAGAARHPELTYKIESDTPGSLQLQFNREYRHFFSVLFTYDSAGVKTSYVTSRNMSFSEDNGVRSIHPNYMVWLDGVFLRIKAAMAMSLDAKGEPVDPTLAARVSFRAVGAFVTFAMTDETSDCGKLEKLGYAMQGKSEADTIRDRKESEEWNEQHAALIEAGKAYMRSTSEVYPAYIEALRPVQVRGIYSATIGNTTTTCGPIVVGFTPLGGRKYTAEFRSAAGNCGLFVIDETNPDLRVPVLPEEIKTKECKKKFLFF